MNLAVIVTKHMWPDLQKSLTRTSIYFNFKDVQLTLCLTYSFETDGMTILS